MKIGFIGTGFVADYYMTTLKNHPELQLRGVFDRSAARMQEFAAFHGVPAYDSAEALLGDPEISIVVNLTTPESHFEVSRQALEAGKHVYCEKPLAMNLDGRRAADRACRGERADAGHRAGQCAERRPSAGVVGARCRADRHAAAGLRRDGGRSGLQEQMGRLALAAPARRGRGCTNSRSAARSNMPATRCHGWSRCSARWKASRHFRRLTFPDKGPGTEDIVMAPDFSVGCLRFRSGPVARLTSGLAAPKDRSLTILGDKGSISVRDLWDNRSAVFLEELDRPRKLVDHPRQSPGDAAETVPALEAEPGRRVRYPGRRASCICPASPRRSTSARGIAAQAKAIEAGERPFFSGNRALHITELALALNKLRALGAALCGEEHVLRLMADFVGWLRCADQPSSSCRTSPPQGGRSAASMPALSATLKVGEGVRDSPRIPPLRGRCPAGQRGARRNSTSPRAGPQPLRPTTASMTRSTSMLSPSGMISVARLAAPQRLHHRRRLELQPIPGKRKVLDVPARAAAAVARALQGSRRHLRPSASSHKPSAKTAPASAP